MQSVEIHATSHVGRVRKGNEDNYLVLHISREKAWTSTQEDGKLVVESQKFEIDDNGVVMAVSDGMGGALAGEVASTMAVETISEKLLNSDDDQFANTSDKDNHNLINRLYKATIFANHVIHEEGRSNPQFQGMGATFTGMCFTPSTVDIIQIGDSRGYLIRGDQIYQITKDQSLVQQLIDAEQISAEEAETHTLKNVILQALGAQNEIFPVSARISLCKNDIYLACSDGLSNKVAASEILRIVTENFDSLQTACVELVKLANLNGGEDNITVVIGKFTGDDLPDPADQEVKLEMVDLGDIHDTADQANEGTEGTAER